MPTKANNEFTFHISIYCVYFRRFRRMYAATIEGIFEQQFHQAQLTEWIDSFQYVLRNIVLMQNISNEELTAVIRFHLKKVHSLGGFHKFWQHLSQIPDVVSVVHSVASLDLTHMRRNIEETMEMFFRHVGLDFEYWMSEVSRCFNISSIWQLNGIEREHFEKFLAKTSIFENVKYQRNGGAKVHGSDDQGTIIIPTLFSFALSEF